MDDDSNEGDPLDSERKIKSSFREQSDLDLSDMHVVLWDLK